jgi:hypothetical protein
MAAGNWRMIDPPADFVALWRENSPDVAVPVAYMHPNGLVAFVGREPYGPYDDPDVRWHISVRYGDPGANGRTPTWDELVQAAHELRPGVCFVIGIPPRSWWMNHHPHVLHLCETRDEPLIQSFRENATGQVPT